MSTHTSTSGRGCAPPAALGSKTCAPQVPAAPRRIQSNRRLFAAPTAPLAKLSRGAAKVETTNVAEAERLYTKELKYK